MIKKRFRNVADKKVVFSHFLLQRWKPVLCLQDALMLKRFDYYIHSSHIALKYTHRSNIECCFANYEFCK